jgi:hypothetical protein
LSNSPLRRQYKHVFQRRVFVVEAAEIHASFRHYSLAARLLAKDNAIIGFGSCNLGGAMSLDELENAVTHLPAKELSIFAQWFEEFMADAWDRKIEADISAGKLDNAGRQADADFEAGRCKPL